VSQEVGVKIENGVYKIWGPPGTGKTTTIASQARDEVMKRGSEAVMICSLTKAAAREVAGRNLPMHDRQIGTLHSHAYRSLGTSIIVAEKKVDEWNAGPGRDPAFRLSGGSADVDEASWDRGGAADGDAKYMEVQTLRARMVPKEMWPVSATSFSKRWERFKLDMDAIDFTDMIDIAYRDVNAAPGDPQVIISDECLSGDSMISLADGTMRTIREIVDGKERLEVLCYDTDSGTVEKRRITNWFRVPRRGRRMMRVGKLVMTEDHPVYIPGVGYIECGKIQTGFCTVGTLPGGVAFEAPPTLVEADASHGFVYCIEVEEHHNFFADGVLVKNCQDSSLLENSLLRKWGDAAEVLILSGDPMQCLYGFRGSDPKTFLRDGTPSDRMRVLDQSYRVPIAVHSKAMDWIRKHSDFVDFSYRPRAVQGSVDRCSATWVHPSPLLWRIEKDISEGKTVMVLASCSYMLRPLISALREALIPFQNTYRIKRGDWNPLRRGHGMSQRMCDYLRPHAAMWGDRARMWNREEISSWIELVRGKGVMRHGAKAELKREAKESSLMELSVNDLLRYFEEDSAKSLLYSVDSVDAALQWIADSSLSTKKKSLEFPSKLILKRGPKILLEDFPLTVGTIHSVKGGEADVVYLWPDLSGAGDEEWHLGGRDSIIRLFYVGMTRAKEKLVICESSGERLVAL
jgi:hypothetical protein